MNIEKAVEEMGSKEVMDLIETMMKINDKKFEIESLEDEISHLNNEIFDLEGRLEYTLPEDVSEEDLICWAIDEKRRLEIFKEDIEKGYYTNTNLLKVQIDTSLYKLRKAIG